MANFGVKVGKQGAWFRATKEEIAGGVIPALWIAETALVLAICGTAIHRKLKSNMANKDDAERQERERAANQAKEDAKLERELAIAKVKYQLEVDSYSQKKKIDLDYEIQYDALKNANPEENYNKDEALTQSSTSWIGKYMKNHPMPELPSIIGFVTKLSPGIQIAALLNILSMFGAMCFSRVRALYQDNKMHAPNLQVIIEGMSGAGKEFFMQLHELLFGSVVQADATNMNNPGKIISTIGVDITTSSLHDICANNKEVHLYIQDSEIKHVTNCMNRKKGVSEEMLCYAFDNALISNMSKNSKSRYHIFLNYTFTGTPGDVAEFIKGKEADGIASRIAWASIPESKVTDQAQKLPDGKDLDFIRGKIDVWREQYCYETDKSGKDKATQETTIDLGYINTALKEWLHKQEKLSKNDLARASVARRYAAMAFHCAIILHMMMDNPTNHGERKNVEKLTIYLADYLIEGFLNKYGNKLREAIKKQRELMNGTSSNPKELTDEVLDNIIKNKKESQRTWKEIANEYGVSEEALRKRASRRKK